MRASVALTVVLVAAPVHAATITTTSPPIRYASLTDPGPTWVRFLVGGNLDTSNPALATLQSAWSTDVVLLDQLADHDARHEFWTWSHMLSEFVFTSQARPGTREVHWSSVDPDPYLDVETIEMIGGDVEVVGGQLVHHWTRIVDGGSPESVAVAIVPEPAALALACLGLLGVNRFHVGRR